MNAFNYAITRLRGQAISAIRSGFTFTTKAANDTIHFENKGTYKFDGKKWKKEVKEIPTFEVNGSTLTITT
jgi:hypothetical protein